MVLVLTYLSVIDVMILLRWDLLHRMW